MHATFGILSSSHENSVVIAVIPNVRVLCKLPMPLNAFAFLRDAAKRRTAESSCGKKSAEKKARVDKTLVRNAGCSAWDGMYQEMACPMQLEASAGGHRAPHLINVPSAEVTSSRLCSTSMWRVVWRLRKGRPPSTHRCLDAASRAQRKTYLAEKHSPPRLWSRTRHQIFRMCPMFSTT